MFWSRVFGSLEIKDEVYFVNTATHVCELIFGPFHSISSYIYLFIPVNFESKFDIDFFLPKIYAQWTWSFLYNIISRLIFFLWFHISISTFIYDKFKSIDTFPHFFLHFCSWFQSFSRLGFLNLRYAFDIPFLLNKSLKPNYLLKSKSFHVLK